MDIDERLGARHDPLNGLKVFFRYILFILIIPFLLFYLICYNAFKDFDIDDANKKYPVNSKDAWEYFVSYVSNDTANILNVSAEDHSNIRQREYLIKFETDSFTMIKIINRNNLHSAESLNCFWKSTFKTITKMDYDKKGSTYKIDFLIVDAGGSRDFACDDVNQRCINRIEDTISILVNLCFKKGGFDLACDSIKSIYLDFKVLPNGCITDIYIDTMFCNFPEKFKNDLYGKLTKLSFGKIIKNDTVSISVPITLAKN